MTRVGTSCIRTQGATGEDRDQPVQRFGRNLELQTAEQTFKRSQSEGTERTDVSGSFRCNSGLDKKSAKELSIPRICVARILKLNSKASVYKERNNPLSRGL